MSELFIELYSEEIRYDLFDLIETEFRKTMKEFFINSNLVSNLDDKNFCELYLTPCRIIFYTDVLMDEIIAENKKIYGPRIDAPKEEIDGFLKAFNINSIDKLKKENYNYIFEQNNIRLKTKDIIKNNIINIFNDFISSFPETVKWSKNYKWVSPLRNIICLFNGEIINFEFCGVTSGNSTFGNKIITGLNKKIEVSNFDDYKTKIKENFVLIDSNEREKIIIKKLLKIQNETNCSIFKLNDDICHEKNLLQKIVNTTEFPNLYLGEFNPDFLELLEIIIFSIVYGKYNCFCLKNNFNNSLSNKFIIFANAKENNKGESIISGFQNTINRKLSIMDLELREFMSESLETKLNELKSLQYYKDFGNVYDEVERLSQLSKFICLFLPHCDLISTEEAAKLCKIDLTTTLVKNNPELKGYLSSYYAKMNNYSEDVCRGIKESYKPKNLCDEIPSTNIGCAVSLANRIDDITTLFISNNKCTSSKDPYGIRKNITSIIKIIIEGNINIPLNILIHKSISLFKTLDYKNNNDIKGNIKQKINEIKENIISLFKTRFINYMVECGHNRNIICSVLDCNSKTKTKKGLNLNLIYNKIFKIEEYAKNNENKYNDIKNLHKRLSNILVNFKISEVNLIIKNIFQKRFFKNDQEVLINSKIMETKKEIKKANKEHNYEKCLNLLFELTPILEEYFKNNLIKTDNAKETNRRLYLLFRVKSILDNFLNFEV